MLNETALCLAKKDLQNIIKKGLINRNQILAFFHNRSFAKIPVGGVSP